MDGYDATKKKEIIGVDHLQRAHDFIDQISEIVTKFQFEFNTADVRKQMCYELKYFFDSNFDEYWQKVSGLHSQELTFVDMTTVEMVGGLIDPNGMSSYQIGISIKKSEPIPFSDFITEYFGVEAVRDRKIKEILF